MLGVGRLPLNEQAALYGKLGGYRSSSKGGGANERQVDITFGAGFEYALSQNIAARAEWQRYRAIGGGAIGQTGDLDVYSVGRDLPVPLSERLVHEARGLGGDRGSRRAHGGRIAHRPREARIHARLPRELAGERAFAHQHRFARALERMLRHLELRGRVAASRVLARSRQRNEQQAMIATKCSATKRIPATTTRLRLSAP